MLRPNFFELFQVPQQFELDQALLERNYRLLQQKAHPDHYVQADSITRAQAQQMAGQINEAYQILSTPLLRAKYLLQLRGVQFDTLDNRVSPAFLMQQMQWQESLEEAIDPLERARVLSDIQAEKRRYAQQLQQLFSENAPAEKCIEVLQALKYIDKVIDF